MSEKAYIMAIIVLISLVFVMLVVVAPLFAAGLMLGMMAGALLSRYAVADVTAVLKKLEEEKNRNEG